MEIKQLFLFVTEHTEAFLRSKIIHTKHFFMEETDETDHSKAFLGLKPNIALIFSNDLSFSGLGSHFYLNYWAGKVTADLENSCSKQLN